MFWQVLPALPNALYRRPVAPAQGISRTPSISRQPRWRVSTAITPLRPSPHTGASCRTHSVPAILRSPTPARSTPVAMSASRCPRRDVRVARISQGSSATVSPSSVSPRNDQIVNLTDLTPSPQSVVQAVLLMGEVSSAFRRWVLCGPYDWPVVRDCAIEGLQCLSAVGPMRTQKYTLRTGVSAGAKTCGIRRFGIPY